MVAEEQLEPYLKRLRELRFVRAIQVVLEPAAVGEHRPDAILRLRTPGGPFTFGVELKSSYVDRSFVNAIIVREKHAVKNRLPMLLLARYLPAPSAEKLAEAGINFLDRAGNMNLRLGENYSASVIGRPESPGPRETKSTSAAKSQLLFAFAATEQASSLSVRDLADVSGISKSSVAKLRQELVDEGILSQSFKIRDSKMLEGKLLSGYEQVLRPRLLINRFRGADNSPQILIRKIREVFRASQRKWALTGAAAAFSLQRFYRAPEVPVFVESLLESDLRELRVLPDKNGPLIFLRAFGKLPFWREIRGNVIAHPWLIYCELMYSSDPRAHEAAEELKAGFLSDGQAVET
ncbi:MAG TPA: type IV toxin-antitoxin system AbiEi family antitoxin [Blastocatellia bacterium]